MLRSIHPSIKAVAAASIIIALGLYIYSNTETLLTGPEIAVAEPANGEHIAATHPITIRGDVSNVTSLTLNGRSIYTDESGRFSEQLLLLSGYNIITIRATDKFGRTQTREIELTTP